MPQAQNNKTINVTAGSLYATTNSGANIVTGPTLTGLASKNKEKTEWKKSKNIVKPSNSLNISANIAKVKVLENAGNSETITISNSDKIGIFSNSFSQGYCMVGKHYLNELSMWSDYIYYNYGHSGDDVLELLTRVNGNESFLGAIPVQQWGIAYGIIAMETNDGALYSANPETYYQNCKKLAVAIEAMGGIPILSTEHNYSKYYYSLNRLNQEFGYLFMDWGYKASSLYNSIYPPFWFNGHPSTRTQWLWALGMKPYLDALPRPRKSLKLFRVKIAVVTANKQNLIYEDNIQRSKIYDEIGVGVTALNLASEKYFDRLDGKGKVFEDVPDEYQKIQAKTAVSFGSYALLEVVTPYDAENINSLKIAITANGISKAYIKKTIGLLNPLPSTRVVSFGITSGKENLTIGETIKITAGVFSSTLMGSYTISGIQNGMVITTTSSTGKVTSGTDVPICSTAGVVLAGSFDYPQADYMNRFEKPLGEWLEVTITNGVITLDNYLKQAMMHDKVGILLEGTNITVTDLEATVSGMRAKFNQPGKMIERKNGASLLTDTLLDDSKVNWVGITGITKYTPVVNPLNRAQSEALPKGITTVREISGTVVLQQPLNTSVNTDKYSQTKVQIRIIARYFPKYINNDAEWATSEIVRGSYDCAELAVSLADNQVAVLQIGAYWNEYIIETSVYSETALILKALTKKVQIAKVECILL